MFEVMSVLYCIYIYSTGCDDTYVHMTTTTSNSNTINHHQNMPSISLCLRLNRFLVRLCSTYQFKNLQVSNVI